MRSVERSSATLRSSAWAGNDGAAAPPLAVVALGLPSPPLPVALGLPEKHVSRHTNVEQPLDIAGMFGSQLN